MIWAQPSPPPSVGGLPPNSPVTCGFASSRPALSRRPCAVGAETARSVGRVRARAKGARPQPAAFRGCSVRACAHLLCWPSGMLRQAFGRDRIAPHRPRWRRLTLTLPSAGVRSPSASGPPSRFTSFISEPASHEVPGFGAPALQSALGLEALRSPWQLRGTTASPHRPAVAIPASAATATCWHTKCRDEAISTRTKAPERLQSCRRGGAS